MIERNKNSALRNYAALVDFSNLINSSLEIEFILNNLIFTCFGKFHTNKAAVIFFTGYSNLIYTKGIDKTLFEEVELSEDDRCYDRLKEVCNINGFPLVLDISSGDKTIGFLILGKRLINKEYDIDDTEFLKTLLNIVATALENFKAIDGLKRANNELAHKINQLNSLFDLSKEFSGILEEQSVTKLLTFAISGQLLVSKCAVISINDAGNKILSSKFNNNELLLKTDFRSIKEPVYERLQEEYPGLYSEGIRILIPMFIKSEIKGVLLVGNRITNKPYTDSDLEYLSLAASIAIISIENAILFKETLEKQKIEKDLELAKKIQKNLLPGRFPESDFFDIVAYNKPARQVGGDYYDIIKLSNDRILFAIADVSGKGVQAALMMANIQAFLKAVSKQELRLTDSVGLINDLVSENTVGGGFITFFCGLLDTKLMELEYVNAGHNPPLFIRNKEIVKLKKGGMILGFMETVVPYLSEKIKLDKGDLLIAFTDGITEAMSDSKEEYSDERLEKLVVANSEKTAVQILNTILDDVENFTCNAEQSDDITSLILKIK